MLDALLLSNVVLWVVVLALLIVVYALARQIGVLHERVAPAGALMPTRGVLVGESVAALALTDVQGRSVRIGGAVVNMVVPGAAVMNGTVRRRGQLILFVSPTCPVCRTLVPVAVSLARSEQLELIFASDGDSVDEHIRYVATQGIGAYQYVLSAELGRAHQVGKLPFALLIDAQGVLRGKGLVNTREHLESLLEAQARNVASIQEYMNQAESTS